MQPSGNFRLGFLKSLILLSQMKRVTCLGLGPPPQTTYSWISRDIFSNLVSLPSRTTQLYKLVQQLVELCSLIRIHLTAPQALVLQYLKCSVALAAEFLPSRHFPLYPPFAAVTRLHRWFISESSAKVIVSTFFSTLSIIYQHGV